MVLATPIHAGNTGIRGTVLMGPIKPGPSTPSRADEAPMKGVFSVYKGDEKVAQFESDRTGAFEVCLPPGEYTIVPHKDTPVPYAEKQTTTVTVPDDGYAVVTIRLDSGMR